MYFLRGSPKSTWVPLFSFKNIWCGTEVLTGAWMNHWDITCVLWACQRCQAGWVTADESEMPAVHLGHQRGQSSAKQSLCLFRLSFLMEGKLCLTRCEEDSSVRRHSETSCCLFLTNRDIPAVWPGQIYDVPPGRVDSPCPHTVSFVCLGPASFVIAILLAGTLSVPACSLNACSLKYRFAKKSLLHAYLSRGRTGILNAVSTHYS